MNRIDRTRTAIAMATLTGIFFPVSMLAQEAQGEQGQELEEIVVTGS